MAETLTIRLEKRDRAILEAAARRHGTGLSAFIRDLVEAEARRLSREAIRADGQRIVAYLERHPEAQTELDTYGAPVGELP
jgi:uncharacterized protein (DUF1778 family)